MEQFLERGQLDPKINPTQAGFLKIFALWILDEDLLWTTGEAPVLDKLFKYLGIKQQLPSDTTVRNELARIYADLHGKVVEEFSVCLPCSVSFFPCGYLLHRIEHQVSHFLFD